ncbi:ABC transporter ATP-binding protein [Glutamicibacter bergerei]|uniref:ABC transporter ATP-binding protein n=1 Tax=Glutamicibacter bergerei TaxID=256702 RepID=A0ABV9MM14_9MICC|nr:ABC transporter ATP-binding protein [Glutamicibacter sp. BW77]PCC32681.1 ABC transporter [Glutamicibacter sp. BW77]HBV10493.1 ABC transporter ATP-binding protein [Micrococcaceae bacterium]
MSKPMGVSDEDNINLSGVQRKQVRSRSFRLLARLAMPQKKLFILTVALVLVSNAARVALPLLIALAIDWTLPQVREGNWSALGISGGAYIICAILAGVLLAWYINCAARISQAMLLDLRQQVFRHTQRLSLEFHENYTSGRIISRQTSDLETLRELLDQGVSELASSCVFVVFTLITIFALDWRSGLVLCIAAVPVTILFFWYQSRSEVLYRESRVVSAKVISTFVETMTGIRAVKAFRREAANDENYGDIAEKYRVNSVRSFNLFGILQPGLVLIGNLTVAALLAYGGFRILDGTLAVGVMVALLLAAKRVFQPVEQIAMFYSSLQSATAALEKVSGLLEEEPSVKEPLKPRSIDQVKGEIVFRDAVFGYGQGPIIMDRFDLKLEAGQTVAVVGQTGAGKSTLAKLISRFYDLRSGSLEIDSVPIQEISNNELREHVVMVTQEAFLFSGSVAENIALGNPTATLAEIQDAAKAVGAHEFILELPEGYDTDLNKRGGRVSAGQRQLISFARAFLADPAVLILDEATSSLDIPSERAVQRGLQQLLGNRTALIIAHRLSTVQIADRVLVVHDGKIIEDGTPEQLIADQGRFASLHKAWKDSLV